MEILYAKIEEGIVASVEVVTDEFVAANPGRYKGYVKVSGACGKGYTYSGDLEAGISGTFTPPQPYLSWVLDGNSVWQPPVERPEGDYYWDENNLNWVEVIQPI